MNKFLQFLLVLLLGSLGMYMFNSIMSFFGVSFQYYGVYLIFSICIGFFFYVLPSKHTNIFV